MINYVQKLLERELSWAVDNHYRAKKVANHIGYTTIYGESGRTIGEIVAGYAMDIHKIKQEIKANEPY